MMERANSFTYSGAKTGKVSSFIQARVEPDDVKLAKIKKSERGLYILLSVTLNKGLL